MEIIKPNYTLFNNVFDDLNRVKELVMHENSWGGWCYDTEDVKGRLHIHNPIGFTPMHKHFCNEIAELMSLEIKPSYVCLMQYMPGCSMYKHKDRPQCEYNFVVAITGQEKFFIEDSSGIEQDIILKENQGVLYSGTDFAHGRRVCDNYFCGIIFHFVDVNFEGNLN